MATERQTTENATYTQRFDEWLGDDTSIRRAVTVYLVLGVYFTFLLLPILYMVMVTFTSSGFLFSSRLFPTPSDFTLDNYVRVLQNGQFQGYFVNSTIVATATTTLTLVTGILAAYSLSRFDYPGRDLLLVGFLSTQMLPYVLILIPFFLLMSTLQLIDSFVGIILAHTVLALPFSVWLLKGYFDDIPEALDEAAKMDGCSRLDVLVRVILPLSVPGIAVAGFYTFIISWNDFLFVSILSQTEATRTLPFGLQLFQSANSIDWGLVLSAAAVTMLPVILLFAILQRWVVEGLASGGLKGL